MPPSVTDPVSNLDFLPVDDAFALEFRSETIEQLVGGDALRRGASERIEAGRSQTNADLVAGRDRVRVQGTLHEHTGHGRAEQAAHLHTTVDGRLDVHAASEDTVLLAGHMRDLWDGGAAIVAAMTDDTVGGGGIRVTTPLDLWVHGLMGVEERIGTCTADAVLMELGATHYEREYGPGVHAARLAVYTGSLYQSSRSTFRALMRVSSGVRNLIAGGGGGGGGGDGDAGDAPAASPPPAPAAGGAGTQAASRTLCTATGAGAGETAQAGVMAEGRSEVLAGIHPGDEVAALVRGAHVGRANVAGASDDLSELRRGTDIAGQLGALQDEMRGVEAGAGGEVRSFFRVSKPNDIVSVLDDTASVHEASALDIEAVIRSGATVPGRDAPELHSTASPRPLPPGVKFGLLGGGDDPVRPASSDFASWRNNYHRLRAAYETHRTNFNWIAIHAFGDAISTIDYRVIEAYVESGGRIDALDQHIEDDLVPLAAYRDLRDLGREAERVGEFDRASEIEEALVSIEQLTVKLAQELDARTPEFDSAYAEVSRIIALDPRIDREKVSDWVEERIRAATQIHQQAQRRGNEVVSVDPAISKMVLLEWETNLYARTDLTKGRDPRIGVYNRIRSAAESGDGRFFHKFQQSHVRMMEATGDVFMHRPAVQGSEAGGATSPPFCTVDSGAAGRLGEFPGVPGASSSATAGTDAGDLGRRMLDQPVVGPADEAHPGTATPRSGDAQAMTTPQPGAESTFWLHPADPVLTPGTLGFDAGLQRAGQQPQHSGEAAMGGTATHRPLVRTPEETLDANLLTVTQSWSRDAFEIERALIAGRLPRGFDSSPLLLQWPGLAAGSEFEALLEMGLLPTRAIDSMNERLRAEEGGRDYIELIQQLEAMKQSIDRALRHRFGYRADADWLATVDKLLKTGSVAQAMGVAPVSVPSRGEDIAEGVRTSLQQLRVESAVPPGPTEWGARELSPGAWSPAQDPGSPPWSRDGSDAGELSPGAWSPAQDPWGLPWSRDGSDAGELSPGALSPAQDPGSPPWSVVDSAPGGLSPGASSLAEDPLSQRPRVGFGEVEGAGFHATQPGSSLGAGGREIAAGPTAGWQAAETPGFGRLASIPAEFPLSRREEIVHRVITGEASAAARRPELMRRYEGAIRAGAIASPVPHARTASALLVDLRWLSAVARTSIPFALLSPSLEVIDWAAIELLLRLLDSPGL